jgi:hypothetical protein
MMFLTTCCVQVAITNVVLWASIWTPYAVVNLIPVLGNVHFVTPMMSQIPALVGELPPSILSAGRNQDSLAMFGNSFSQTLLIGCLATAE